MVYVLIGTPITITVNISTPGTNPVIVATGIVVLQDNGITVGTQELVALPLVGDNVSGTVFTLDSELLGLGTHNFIVYYAGDANFPATSFTSTELDKTIVNPISTACSITTSVNPINYGQFTTIVCTITSSSSIPQGEMQLYINSAASGAPVVITPTSGGATASITTSGFMFGANSVYAVFSNGGAFNTSTSNTITETLNLLTPTIQLQSGSNPSTFNTSITFTATVSGSLSTPGGNVVFYDGATALSGSVNLAGGIATFSTSALAGGDHSITAVYSGNSTYKTITSSALNQVVNASSTTTGLIVSGGSISGTYPNYTLTIPGANANATFTATISSSNGTANGVVVFLDTSSDVSSPFTAPGVSVALNGSGIAATTQTFLSSETGAHPISATFKGNSNYSSSVDNITLTITT